MNKRQNDILNNLIAEPFVNQRLLAEKCGYSLGIVNRAIRELMQAGYIDDTCQPTEKALAEYQAKTPRNAVILAAGYGMRMVPINMETPKAFLEVNGERLIERLIRQLQEAGVQQIYVVVGFLKERFEYLMDDYGVELVVNPEYSEKNNLHSMKRVCTHLGNSYIVPCDIWCRENPFRRRELYSWYMVSDQADPESEVRVNRNMELVRLTGDAEGNAMVGISYLLEEDAAMVADRIRELSRQPKHDEDFWEAALYVTQGQKEKMRVNARIVNAADFVEIDTYEQLRELDRSSNQLQSEAISIIQDALQASPGEITDITVLKKGMTNRSFLFRCKGERYIMRIPGEGTEQLINRAEEAAVYRQIAGMGICDDIVYVNPENGYKITRYMENSRVCDPENVQDLQRCMERLRSFHQLQLTVEHEFDIFRQIEYYETLWEGNPSVYRDYKTTKANVLSLRPFIDAHAAKKSLTHIDAVPDNFLFAADRSGGESIFLIDWEYAGMQDPHVDIAMFCIYALYGRQQVDQLIDLYFKEGCVRETRLKIYCYIAACGLLWSNWCEYKRQLGVEFGEYSLRQYRYAKDYFRIVRKELGE